MPYVGKEGGCRENPNGGHIFVRCTWVQNLGLLYSTKRKIPAKTSEEDLDCCKVVDPLFKNKQFFRFIVHPVLPLQSAHYQSLQS